MEAGTNVTPPVRGRQVAKSSKSRRKLFISDRDVEASSNDSVTPTTPVHTHKPSASTSVEYNFSSETKKRLCNALYYYNPDIAAKAKLEEAKLETAAKLEAAKKHENKNSNTLPKNNTNFTDKIIDVFMTIMMEGNPKICSSEEKYNEVRLGIYKLTSAQIENILKDVYLESSSHLENENNIKSTPKILNPVQKNTNTMIRNNIMGNSNSFSYSQVTSGNHTLKQVLSNTLNYFSNGKAGTTKLADAVGEAVLNSNPNLYNKTNKNKTLNVILKTNPKETMNALNKTINLKKENININSSYTLQNGSLKIEAETKEDLVKLKEKISCHNNFQVKQPITQYPRLVILDLCQDNTVDEMTNMVNSLLNEHSLPTVQWLGLRKQGVSGQKALVQLHPASWRFLMMETKIRYNFNVYKVRNYINILRCQKCKLLGHSKNSCQELNEITQAEGSSCVECVNHNIRLANHPRYSEISIADDAHLYSDPKCPSFQSYLKRTINNTCYFDYDWNITV